MYDTQAASNVETQTDFSYCMSVPEMLLQIRLERLSLVRFTGEKKKPRSLLAIYMWNQLLMPFPQIINLIDLPKSAISFIFSPETKQPTKQTARVHISTTYPLFLLELFLFQRKFGPDSPQTRACRYKIISGRAISDTQRMLQHAPLFAARLFAGSLTVTAYTRVIALIKLSTCSQNT